MRGRETQVSGDLGAFKLGWEGSTEPHRSHCASAGGEEALGTGEGQQVTESHTGIQTQRDSGKWAGASARRREQPHPRGRRGTPPRTADFTGARRESSGRGSGLGAPEGPEESSQQMGSEAECGGPREGDLHLLRP